MYFIKVDVLWASKFVKRFTTATGLRLKLVHVLYMFTVGYSPIMQVT